MFNAPMTYGLSNAANRNIWQYNLTTAAPNDIFGAMNDASIWKYGAQVGSMVDSTAALQMNLVPMMEQFYAQMSQMWQQVMTNIQAGNANSSITIPGIDGNNGVNRNNTKISEGKIITLLQRMGSGKAVADRINQEIDINGNKTTILARLVSLVTAYRNNPKEAELSTENYKKVWEIADRYHKSGDVSSADFEILIEIAKNPTSAVDEVDGEDDGNDDGNDDEDVIIRPNPSERTPEKITAIVEDFKNALVGNGTNTEVLGYAMEAINKDNILEVFDAYKEHIRAHKPNEKQDIVEAILDDCSLWGGGDSNGWDIFFGTIGVAPVYNKLTKGKWFAQMGDDAKPRLEILQEALIARANDFIKEHGEDKGITKADVQAFTLPTTEHNSLGDGKRDDQAIKTAFKTFINKLKQAESAVYED